jgi:hypothetical protein
MTHDSWTATGVIEAPPERVRDTFLVVREGPVGNGNAPLLRLLPGAGRFMTTAHLRGGPHEFTLHYGTHPGGTVEVNPAEGRFAFQGGYKFRAEYHFAPHPEGTLLTYAAINVAPPEHRDRRAVRLQFRLAGRLKIGLRGTLKRIGRDLGCRTRLGG